MKLVSSVKSEKGVIGLYLAIVILVLALSMIASVSFGIFTQQQVIRNLVQSTQAHYAAESGVEDALLRLATGKNVCNPPGPPPCSNSISLWTGPAITITVSDVAGGARTVTVEGDSLNRIRKTEVVFEQTSTGVGFFYGAQVGDGGVQMDNSSRIVGNVFSGGDVEGNNTPEITGTVQVSGSGNVLQDIAVGGDAFVDHCQDSTIGGTLYALTESGCGSFVAQSPPAPVAFPITQSDVDDWKLDAQAGGTLAGDYVKDSGVHTLGPKVIDGDLILTNSAQLIVTGTLWVTGSVQISNSVQVRLDSGYGTTSGMIIADGTILLQNNTVSSGSGQAGSYLMYLSTSSFNPALTIKNFARADILYTTNGFVQIENNTDLREVTAYGVHLANSAELTYEIGLQTTAFTSGPGGGWQVTSWKEVQ